LIPWLRQRQRNSIDQPELEGEEAEDLLLLRRIRLRDVGALGTLYDKWVDRAYSVAVHILSSAGEAEEVVEDVFSNLWRDADQYHSGLGSVGGWIILDVRRLAIARRSRR